MMNILKYILSVVILTAIVSCNKLLEKEPDNRAKLNTPQKVSQLLATAYPAANYMAFAESISDNVADRGSGTTEYETMDPYMFRDVRDNQQDSPEFYWDACYAAIAAANQALQAISQAPDSVNYSAQKGEALVCRAYAHFMLVSFFSKMYNPSTAATDPGIPYVTEPENVVIKQYDRKTVQYVYDMIEKDLLAGLPLLKDGSYTVPAYHFTTIAAHAFAARFYLFKGNFANVLTHTAQVVPATNVAAALRPWNTTYAGLTFLELQATYQKATEPANLLLAETSSAYMRYISGSRYAMDYTIANNIITDVPAIASGSVTAQWEFINQSYIAGTNGAFIPKIYEYFVKESINANIGFPYVMVPLFTMEEALFNRAEAMVYSNNTQGAIDLLNAYLSTRITNYNPSIHTLTAAKATTYYQTTNVQLALLNLIIDYKQAEFIEEGMRWFDLQRYDIPVQHVLSNGTTLTLAADSKQRLFQLPQSVTLSGIALNPR